MRHRRGIRPAEGVAFVMLSGLLAAVLPALAQTRGHETPAAKKVASTVDRPATSGILLPPGSAPRPYAVEGGSFILADGGLKDLVTGLVWSASARFTTGTNSDWRYAMSYCDKLVEGGYSDWRAPTLAELQQVAADGAAGHLDTYPAYYDKVWSSTTKGKNAHSVVFNDPANPDNVFADLEPNGYVELQSKYNYLDVVAVRQP